MSWCECETDQCAEDPHIDWTGLERRSIPDPAILSYLSHMRVGGPSGVLDGRTYSVRLVYSEASGHHIAQNLTSAVES